MHEPKISNSNLFRPQDSNLFRPQANPIEKTPAGPFWQGGALLRTDGKELVWEFRLLEEILVDHEEGP